MRHPHGLFGWVDLSTNDVGAASAFYSGLFGWELTEEPLPFGGSYVTCRKDGLVVAGIGGQQPGMAEAGVPSTWNSYVIVADVDEVLGAVEAAGGTTVMPGLDVMTQGRMAVVADPSGAVVGLWQPRDHEGGELFNAPGSLTWNELQTRDLEAATRFYTTVFGWRWEPMEGSDYQVAHLDTKAGDDTSNAGAMTMPDAVPAEAPSSWNVYFAAEDCDDALARAQELGGSVFLPAMAMGPGRFGGLTDPTGAMVFVGSFPS